jgi:SAM-dependent methyltransferase
VRDPDPTAQLTRPPLDPAGFEAWNEAMVAKYDNELFHQNPSRLVRYVERRRVRALLQLLEYRPDDSLLEVGCGAGYLLAAVGSERSVGVDISEAQLEKARARCGPKVKLLKADAESLPFESASFDRVYCSEVLEHVLHPGKVIGEIVRVTRPDGRVVLTIPVDKTIIRAKKLLNAFGLFRFVLGSAKAGQYQPPEDNDWHLHRLDLRRLRELTRGQLVERRLKAIPNRLVPVHYVVAYALPGGGARA